LKKLIAFDPGKTTGMSIWEYDDVTPLTHLGHGQIEGGLDGFLDYFYSHGVAAPFDVIVAESFVLDGRTPNPDVTPLRIEGVLQAHSHRYGTLVRFQRNNFKAHVTNEFLKKHGLYWAGAQHAMDSARHALAYMKTSRHMATLKKYFNDEDDRIEAQPIQDGEQ
jgi:hypothetical protein